MLTECSREGGFAEETQMCSPEGEKRLFTCSVRTGDAIQIDLNYVSSGTALGDCLRQAIRPFPDKLAVQDNLRSILQIDDRGSQHDQGKCSFLTKR
jgi:hypothetical protein